MSRLKLDEPEHDSLPHPGSSWDMPYSGTYLPHSSPMPFNYTNETTCYSLTRDGSGSGTHELVQDLYLLCWIEYGGCEPVKPDLNVNVL